MLRFALNSLNFYRSDNIQENFFNNFKTQTDHSIQGQNVYLSWIISWSVKGMQNTFNVNESEIWGPKENKEILEGKRSLEKMHNGLDWKLNKYEN